MPTLETLAAVDLLRSHLPDLRVQVVNVADLMTLRPASEHPHGLSGSGFDSIFTPDRPVIFLQVCPWLIHRLTYKRINHADIHVRVYREEGREEGTTTSSDMVALDGLDRFHLATDVIERVPRLRNLAAHLQQQLRDQLVEHRLHVGRHGDDLPEGKDWRRPADASRVPGNI